MLDGICLSKDQTAVVALGIDSEGCEHILEFTLGCSESLVVSREVMSRIVNRGFNCDHLLYVVLGGRDALRSAVVEFIADAVNQRCLGHKHETSRASPRSVIGANRRVCSRVFAAFNESKLRRKSLASSQRI